MPYPVGDKKQAFIGWALVEPGCGLARGGERPASWEMPCGIRLAAHPPRIDPTPLVAAEHPWESSIDVYSTLLEDEGRFRLYYECYHAGDRGQDRDHKAM